MNGLRKYSAVDFVEIEAHTSSKGNICKYSNGKQWIKVNGFGYETLAEVLSSRVALQLGLNAVIYDPCFLSDKPACVSDTFLQSGCSEVTLGRLLQQTLHLQSSSDLYRRFEQNETPASRIAWVIDSLQDIVDANEFLAYLADMLFLDSIVLNTDRHLYNIVFIQNEVGEFHPAPIFDCGAALLSDLEDFPMSLPIDIALRKIKAKPFSTSFEKQLRAIEHLLGSISVAVDQIEIGISDLYDYFSLEHIQRAVNVLLQGLSTAGVALHIDELATKTDYFRE